MSQRSLVSSYIRMCSCILIFSRVFVYSNVSCFLYEFCSNVVYHHNYRSLYVVSKISCTFCCNFSQPFSPVVILLAFSLTCMHFLCLAAFLQVTSPMNCRIYYLLICHNMKNKKLKRRNNISNLVLPTSKNVSGRKFKVI